MAATVSPWGKPGAWALDAEEHEAELLKDQQDQAARHQSEPPSADFPSLAAAAATKPKKKKGQSIPLSEFQTYGGPKPSPQSTEPKGLTTEDLMMLPTGPRQRTAEELDRNRLGGGFKNYGQNSSYDRGNRYSNGEDSSNSRWGSSRVFDESRRSNDGSNREFRRESAPPSRADEIDDWGAGKKPMLGNGFERRERGGFFDSNSSKADESDSWVSNKSFVPSEGRRSGGMGGGSERERRGGFPSNGGGADSDNWGRKPEGGRGGSGENGGGGADSDTWGKRSEGGRGGTGERPRLNLQPRSIPLNNGNQDASGAAVKPKGSSPFGNARPREEVLAEKGQDWKKIDEQLESTKIKDTVERAERPSGASFERKGFGGRGGRSPDDRIGRSWRKPESVDSRPQSAGPEMVDDGPAEEN